MGRSEDTLRKVAPAGKACREPCSTSDQALRRWHISSIRDLMNSRYPTAGGCRRALEDRLRVRAGRSNQQSMRLRKNVVFQRLLARLLVLSPDRWVLKGGLALDFRLADSHIARPRATKDMD